MTTFTLKVLDQTAADTITGFHKSKAKEAVAVGNAESATGSVVRMLAEYGVDCAEKIMDPKGKGSLTCPLLWSDLHTVCFPLIPKAKQVLAEMNLKSINAEMPDGTPNPLYKEVQAAKKQTATKIRDIRDAAKKVWRAEELALMDEDEAEAAAEADALTKFKAKQAAQEKKAPEVFTEAELAKVAPAFQLIARVLAEKNMAPVESEPSH